MFTFEQRINDIRQFFDERAGSFDDVHMQFVEGKRLLTTHMVDNPKHVIDLGGGTGMELVTLYERYPDVKTTVIDLSSEMLERLRKRPFADRLEIVCGDFFEIPFGTDCDAVISTSTLHHFTQEDKRRLFAKILDCLRSGGRFINCDFVAMSDEEEKDRFDHFDEYRQTRPHVDTPLFYENEARLLREVGFLNVQVLDGAKDNYRLFIAEKA